MSVYTYFVDGQIDGDWRLVEDSCTLQRAQDVAREHAKDYERVEIWCKETDQLVATYSEHGQVA